MKNLAIITARGGSKRIPGKNIREFFGKPIIHYSIHAALSSGLFDKVMVSTDSDEIAEVALRAGAEVPFKRSPKTSDDHAVLADVVAEVIEEYKKQGAEFDNFCCILATAPFLSAERLAQAYNALLSGEHDAIFPVLKYSYPIRRALQIDSITRKVSMIWPEFQNVRSQDIPDAFHDCGQFYWLTLRGFATHRTLFTPSAGVIELSPWEMQDIDTEEDWTLAELKYQLLQKI
nr:pseudaminic acid cytidylyltransferase [uncultured Chitinophaga sp.]